LRDKLFVIPWGMVRPAPETEDFALVDDETTLEEAPYCSPTAWGTQSLFLWILPADRYWKEKHGLQVGRENGPQSTYSKASDLIGLTVQNTAGKHLGAIEELLLTPETGEISYVLLSAEAEQANGGKIFFALPWSVMRVNAKQRFLSAALDRTKVSQSQNVLCDNTASDHAVKYCQRKRARGQKHSK
jgi:sporulation protein YlmC with PRC-barrel domain